MAHRLRVLHVIPAYFPARRYGGPTECMHRLCEALPAAGVDVDVVTTDADGPDRLDVPLDVPTHFEGVPVRYFRRTLPSEVKLSWPLLRHLAEVSPRYDLLHVTGLFSFPSTMGSLVARARRRPYVISPHGILRAPALAQKRYKKAPYWHLVERANVAHADALHAASELEADDIRRLLPASRVLTIPFGIHLEPPREVPRAPHRVLFLGRLHPIKRLDRLLRAMRLVTLALPDAELVLAGPDDEGERPRLERLLAELTPRPRVRWLGLVDRDEKARLLAGAAVLALVSDSENFGQVVLEALAASTPVVVTRGCPWQVVETAGAGFWVEPNEEAVASALLHVLNDPMKAALLGGAALRLAARYAWPEIARAMAEAYADVVARSALPPALPTAKGR
jgi:glycosyltransferase involved in cell wall biosynthesis